MEVEVAAKVLTVGGLAELTAENRDRFGRKIRADLNGHTTIEIDLSRTTFMDCHSHPAIYSCNHSTHQPVPCLDSGRTSDGGGETPRGEPRPSSPAPSGLFSHPLHMNL